jgi:hypothetical protein
VTNLFANTENLSVTEQYALITDIQNVPTTVEIQEDGSEYVTFGVTPASEAAGAKMVAAFWPAIQAAARLAPLKGREGYSLEDGESAALEEFVRAVREYDLTSDTPFHHTLSTRLRFAVLRAVREDATVFSVPAVQIARYHRAMHGNGLDAASALEDVKANPGKWDLTAPAFMAIHRAMTGGFSLSEDGAGVLDTLVTESPEDAVIRREYVRWLLDQTTDRQETICRLAYGFTGQDTESLRVSHGYREGDVLEDLQVADCLDMARSTVNRERLKALATMRAAAEKSLENE